MAFQRDVSALTQYIAREGHHRVPPGHAEEIVVESETAPVIVKLGVWVTNTRRDKLSEPQRAALQQLGVD
ncbi:helicase associated domain-containing protein [Streptomyces sp. NBC_01578]|uniref:helicase associated domain-containing protein n=1 Tax=unclassified Streptomyces TaxID=2593676 RepID=UPI00386F8D93|nr:helicase associated domain-containing protein [Streptomyces sp. NBC_01643]